VLYELRVYDVVPGKLQALIDRFENVTNAYFEKHGIKIVGFWTDDVGTNNRLTYMLAYEDAGQRQKSRAAFAADQERVAKFAETERDGPLVSKITNTLMVPTRFSPLQ
jgi:hypothetical protein